MSDINDAGTDNSLAVKISGEVIKVYADDGPEYIMRMANYINYIIDEFKAKKGHGVRQTILLAYAALELCHAYFQERDSQMTETERSYEKMFQMEVFSHKRTKDQLDSTEKRLADTERQLSQVRKDLDDFVSAFNTETGEITT
ncbi:MAG: cell division protein ZapA [Defluviitaleaceae bacterium]|nr:cell division protein ZapA [Defluviitaleaceae bacterium]MCL2836873.1 cell division protein ZapA [Defluviitaleaceae bacterium]